MSSRKEPAVHGSRASALEPGPHGKRQADRSDVRQEFARKRARTGFEPKDKRTAASPSCPRVSHDPCLLIFSLRFRPCEADAAAFRRAHENALHPATGSLSRGSNSCKAITLIWLVWLIEKGARRLSRWRSGAGRDKPRQSTHLRTCSRASALADDKTIAHVRGRAVRATVGIECSARIRWLPAGAITNSENRLKQRALLQVRCTLSRPLHSTCRSSRSTRPISPSP